MAFKILSESKVKEIVQKLTPRFLGRDQDHLLALADEAADAAGDYAYDLVQPLQQFRETIESPAGATDVGIYDQGDHFLSENVEDALQELAANQSTLGTVTSVDIADTTGLVFTGGPITGAGTFVPLLSVNLQSWSGINPTTKQDALGFIPENSANKGVANGYASLDGTAKVAAAQLPGYVDDVLEYPTQADFPATGTTGILYIEKQFNKAYRWGGTSYVEISPSPGSTDSVPEGAVNLYFTDNRALTAIGTRSITAGNGLTGGGDLSANRTITLGTPTTITGTSTNSTTPTSHSHALTLLSADVTNALGFTPYNSTNPAGYTSNTGTVTSVGVANTTGLSWTGGPITTSGTLTPTLSTNLQSWSGIAPSAKLDKSVANTAGIGLSYGVSDVNSLNGMAGGAFCRYINTTTNAPTASYYAALYMPYDGTQGVHIASNVLTDELYFRRGAGTAWSRVWHDRNDGAGSGLDADTVDGYQPDLTAANTIALRNVNGDLQTRLFRSTYTTTNSNIQYVMTQVDPGGTDNYIRPSTLAQLKTSLALDYADVTGAVVGVSAGNGNGLYLWNGSSSYAIYMSSSADATYGGRAAGDPNSDYNMYFKMTGGTNRGFTFKNGSTVVGGISGSGVVSDIKGDVRQTPATTSNATTQIVATHVNTIVEKSNTTAYNYAINANIGSQGDMITFVNSGTAGNLGILQGTGVTIVRNGTSGTVTVPPGSMVTCVLSATANKWICG